MVICFLLLAALPVILDLLILNLYLKTSLKPVQVLLPEVQLQQLVQLQPEHTPVSIILFPAGFLRGFSVIKFILQAEL